MWDNNLKLKSYFHKHRLNLKTKRSYFLNSGKFGIIAMESGCIHQHEIRAVHFFLKKKVKKSGKVWYNLSPNHIITKKPIETRMGKGKGGFSEFVAVVKQGRILLEITGPSDAFCISVLSKVSERIALPVKLVKFSI